MSINSESLTIGNPSLIKKVLNKLDAGLCVSIDFFSAEEDTLLEKIAKKAQPLITWDVALGFRFVNTIDGGIAYSPAAKALGIGEDEIALQHNITSTLDFMYNMSDDIDGVFVMLDINKFIGDPASSPAVLERLLKAVIDKFKSTPNKRLILAGQGIKMPADFKGRVSGVLVERPTAEEIRAEIEEWLPGFQDEFTSFSTPSNESEWLPIIRSAQGLTISEVVNIVREIAYSENQVGELTAKALHEYKVEQLRELGVEVALPPNEGVGGLHNVKGWLNNNLVVAMNEDEEDDDDLKPKAIAVVGVPGSGKSLVAKTTGKMLNLPTFKVDSSAFFGSLVGESESKTKNLLSIISAAAPGILFIDEVDKAFAGVGNSAGDSGVGARVFGIFLTWMQDQASGIFSIFTANNLSNLPPEFLRRGRFDEIFFFDLPNEQDREEIISIHLKKRGKLNDPKQLEQWAADLAANEYSKDFVGAEIEQAVKVAAVAARNNGQKHNLSLDDLRSAFIAAKDTILAVQQKEKIELMREQASRFTPASHLVSKATQAEKTVTVSRSAKSSKFKSQNN